MLVSAGSIPPISFVSVYKLVRFYSPSSEAQYVSTRATLTVFSMYSLLANLSLISTCEPIKAIVAMLLLLATFGVGLKCFFDFGKGLYGSKTSGQSLLGCLSSPLMLLKCVTEYVPQIPSSNQGEGPHPRTIKRSLIPPATH